MSALEVTILKSKQHGFPTKVILKFRHIKKCYNKTVTLQKSLAKTIFAVCFVAVVAQAQPFGRGNFDLHLIGGIRGKLAMCRKLGILCHVLMCRGLMILMKHTILWQQDILITHVILRHHVIHRSGSGVMNGKGEASIALIIGFKSILQNKKHRFLDVRPPFGRLRRSLALLLVRACIVTNPVATLETTYCVGGDLFQKLHRIVPGLCRLGVTGDATIRFEGKRVRERASAALTLSNALRHSPPSKEVSWASDSKASPPSCEEE